MSTPVPYKTHVCSPSYKVWISMIAWPFLCQICSITWGWKIYFPQKGLPTVELDGSQNAGVDWCAENNASGTKCHSLLCLLWSHCTLTRMRPLSQQKKTLTSLHWCRVTMQVNVFNFIILRDLKGTVGLKLPDVENPSSYEDSHVTTDITVGR